MLTNFIERYPSLGIIASLSGFGTAALYWLHIVSVFLGVLGALFAVFAGYYTFRIKRSHWMREKEKQAYAHHLSDQQRRFHSRK